MLFFARALLGDSTPARAANLRRTVCWLAVWLAALFPAATAQAQPAARPERPNILYCLADDWAWPDASAYGQAVVKTPTFDRIAPKASYSARPSWRRPPARPRGPRCSRAWRPIGLERGANLNGTLLKKFITFPDRLEAAGYRVGYTRKGWGPGGLEGSGRERNPAGPEFKDFAAFLEQAGGDAPFCFWFGSRDPHRAYDEGSGVRSGMNPQDIRVPAFLPDTPTVRSDLADYYFAIQRFDRELGQLVALLEKTGRLANTIVIMTGDNGSPFPRAKATCYDAGTHVPLAVRWPARIPRGRVVTDFISLTDLAPTLLQVAGLPVPEDLVGRSFFDVLMSDRSGRVDANRDRVFTERERHVVSRAGGKSYPIRALRTESFHYLRNLRPDLLPAGDEDDNASPIGAFGDVDNSPTKTEILRGRQEPAMAPFYRSAFAPRPVEELFDVRTDPFELHNLAADPAHAETLKQLRGELDRWMTDTGDPRAGGESDVWDK